MLDTTTHVAGPIIKVGERLIQRCLVCGEKLADNVDAARMPSGRTDEASFWDEGQLVKAAHGDLGGMNRQFIMLRKLPRDFCIELVELQLAEL